jgi:hypothetical protein
LGHRIGGFAPGLDWACRLRFNFRVAAVFGIRMDGINGACHHDRDKQK